MIIGSITITSLGSIGNNVAGDTLIPVVNMDGVPTTQKMDVANLTSYILGQGNIANLTIQNLTIEESANLGNIANLTILGGTNGYVLQTDGAGNLSWTAQIGGGGNGSVAGANTQVQFNDAGSFGANSGFTFNKTAGALAVTKVDTADVFHLNGVVVENSDLTHGATAALVLPANGNTTVPAQINNTYGNVQITTGITAGSLKNWVFDNTGNLSTPGNVFVNGQLVADGDIIADGNISVNGGTIFGGTPTEVATNVAITDIQLGDANTNQPVVITFDDNTFNYPIRGVAVIANVNAPVDVNGTWYFEAWYDNQLALFTDDTYTSYEYGTDWAGYVDGGDIDITINSPASDVKINSGGYDTTFTNDGRLVLSTDADVGESTIQTPFNANLVLDVGGDSVWQFNTNGQTILPVLNTQRGDVTNGTITGYTLLGGDGSQEFIISTPDGDTEVNSNSQRIVINPGKGADGTSGEGGDIYLWAGRGGDTGGSGGDIKIRGGQGGGGSGAGGYIRMEAGDADNAGGQAGYIDITGGYGGTGNPGGYVRVTGGQGTTGGGEANIQGGYAYSGQGGNVNIVGGGSNDGLGSYGNINISAGASTWTLDNSGNLVLPRGGIVHETNIPFGGLSGNTIALFPSGGTNADQQLLVYPTAGGDNNHLHLTSGNLYNTELFLGNDNLYVKLANTGDIIINTNDDAGNTAQWTFGTDGNVSVPGNTLIYTPIATSGAGGNSITIQAGSSDSFASNPGGNLNLVGGYGSFGDGGGPPGGNVNITSGGSYDSHAGNVNITTGYNNWTFDYTGNLTLPTISLGDGVDEQTIVSSQRKVIPPFRYSAVIDGVTPTLVYEASIGSLTLKSTIVVQHQGYGLEMFDVSAVGAGADVIYSVSNRLNATGQPDTSVSVDWYGSGPSVLAITLTVNSGAGTSWVTYDTTEFGIAVD